MIDDGENGAEDITNQILHNPMLLEAFLEVIVSFDSSDSEHEPES